MIRLSGCRPSERASAQGANLPSPDRLADTLLHDLVALPGPLILVLDDLFVFPVSIAGRFKGAATQFLGTVDEYVAAFVAVAAGGGDAQRLDPAHARVLAAYAQLEQTLPSVAFYNFPFVQTDSPLTQQGTQLAALEAEVARLALAAKDPGKPAGNARVRRLADAARA